MSDKKCKGLASVQCCNFDIKKCKYRSDEDDCYNPEVIKEALEKQLARYSKPKRTPDSNGVLPLEQMEFEKIRAMQKEDYSVKKVYLEGNVLMYDAYKIILGKEDKRTFIITNYKAIAYLLNLFAIGGE